MKNICCTRGEGAVDHSTVTRWLKKFHFSCKNFDDQVRSAKPKTVNYEAVLQFRVANLRCTQRVSGKLNI